MALIVEDGTGVLGAESYASVADADDYFALYGVPAKWAAADEPTKEVALRNGTRFVDQAVRYFGTKVETDQALEFPRTEFVTSTGEIIWEGIIPKLLIDATIEAAGTHLEANINSATTSSIKAQSYGDTSITYGEFNKVYIGQLKNVLKWISRFGVNPSRQIPILRS